MLKFESSRPEVFCKKGVLRNLAKFTGEHLCQSTPVPEYSNKVVGLTPATLLKRRLWHSCFPVTFVKFLGTSFIKEHLWWLLLKIGNEELEITNGDPQKSRNGALLRDVIKHLNLEILNNKATEGK